MDKFIKVGVAVAVAFGLSFAEPLWRSTTGGGSENGGIDGVPGGQVQFPWVVTCWEGGGDVSNKDHPCYKDVGGWWYGYIATPHETVKECDGDQSTDNDKVLVNINGWKSFVGPDYHPSTCEGPPITNPDNGNFLIGDGLELRFQVGNGIPSIWEPDIAAVAVNLSGDGETDKNMVSYNGFCLTYSSTHTAAHDFAMELGWWEGTENGDGSYGFDTWIAPINVGTGIQVQNFTWNGAEGTETYFNNLYKKKGDFMQQGWDDGDPDIVKRRAGAPFPISIATEKMRSVKIRLKNADATIADQTVDFTIYQFGFLNDCNIEGLTSIVAKGAVQNAAKFNLAGRTFSMLSEKASVQIINLQGALVQTKTLAKNETMDLSSLPTGVYMVRIPAIGYSSRIMLK
jgi:hypothetical protein